MAIMHEDGDQLSVLVGRIAAAERRLSELERPSGTQIAKAVEELRQLVEDLEDYVNALAASGVVWAGPVTTTGLVQADAGLTSVGVATNDLSLIAGPRTPVWIHDASGSIGYAPSTREAKTNIRDVPFTADQFRSLKPKLYKPKAFPDAPDEVGLMAEDLIAAGLGVFVLKNADGEPKTIDYAAFAAVAALVLAKE